MGKRRSSKPSAGQRVRVNDDTTMPEFPDLAIGGWCGMVLETQGRGSSAKVILEWDQDVQDNMPEDYKQHCESQNLFPGMACLPMADVQALDA